jgi:hypothetical protein
MPTQDSDIEAMTEAELLALPESLIPAGSLTKFWALHAGAIQKENTDELARERSGESLSRRMIGAEPTQEDREREQQRHYEQALRDLRTREDALLARIEQQERQIAQRRQEIEDNAIRLRDGRLVYVDGKQYRDGQGRVLEGNDADEARQQHGKKPNASTWQQKTEADRQWEEMERLRREIEERRQTAGQGPHSELKQDADAVTRNEQQFNTEVEIERSAVKKADLDAYSANYSALADTGTGSAAGQMDGKTAGISGAFALNAAPGSATPSAFMVPQDTQATGKKPGSMPGSPVKSPP